MTWEEIIQKLNSKVRGHRMDGWSMLRAESAQQLVSEERYLRLSQLLMDEQDDGVWHMGVSVMIALKPRSPTITPPGQVIVPGDRLPLADWLWQPFREPSVVFGVSDPRYRRRDEGALIMLARHLSHPDFPQVQFHPALLRNPRWSPVLAQHFHAGVCFVGRLGLYGPEALRLWGNPSLRFDFRTHDLSKRSRRPGQLDPYFHCIYERTSSGARKYYRTIDQNGRRTDYGLVQRYAIQYEGQLIVVVLCAGSTTVGTLAAAQWAARNLPRPLHSSDLILSPDGLTPSTTMEALLEVTADLDTHEWVLTGVKLKRLFVGDSEWDEDVRHWRTQVGHEVTIKCETSGPLRPSGVLIEGELRKMKVGSQASQLLAALYQLSGGVRDAAVGLDDLKRVLKPDYKGRLSEAGLKRSLSLLKYRYLYAGLVIEDPVILKAKLTLQKPPGAARPHSTARRPARGRVGAIRDRLKKQARSA